MFVVLCQTFQENAGVADQIKTLPIPPRHTSFRICNSPRAGSLTSQLAGSKSCPRHGAVLPIETFLMTKSLVTISLLGKKAEAILRTYELFVYANMHYTVGRGSTRSPSVDESLWKRLWICRKVDSTINDITLPTHLVKMCYISDTPPYVVN